MYASPISQQPPGFPMTYMQGSPLNNVGYHYPQSYPPSATFGGYGYPMQGYGYGSKPLSGGYLQQPYAATTGIKSVQQLKRGITDPAIITSAQQKVVLGANIQKSLAYQTSSRQIGIQQGYSQIQYIPYQSYYIDYQQRQFVQNVTVPVERTIKDYYAVEHVVDFVPKQIQQTIVQMVPEERTTTKLFYVPVQTQVVHMPQGGDNTHTTKKTNVVQQQKTVVNTQTIQERQRIISRPIPQGQTVTKQMIQQQFIKNMPPPRQVQQFQQIQQVQQIPVPPTMKQVQTVQIPSQAASFQSQQVISSGSQAAGRTQVISSGSQAGRTQIIQGQPPLQPQPQIIQGQRVQTNIVSQSPPKLTQLPAQQSGQFIQTQQALNVNKMQLQKKMSIPDDAKVNYQYSTRTVRNLSPQQLKAMGYQPRSAANSPTKIIQNQPQPQQLLRPQPVVTQTQPQNVTTTQQTLNPTLMKNKQVDLADSQHIDITKSTFHAFYGTSNQSQGLAQGTMTGTNPAVYTNNSSAFSFGDQANNASTNVNRSTGGFAPIPEGQPNRISNGSVYDYDQYRGDY